MKATVEFWMAGCVRRWAAEAQRVFQEDPMTVKGNGSVKCPFAEFWAAQTVACLGQQLAEAGLLHTPCNERDMKEVTHEGDPCIHCGQLYAQTYDMCPARVLELVRIISELDKTADGVPITPETELWQAHPCMNHSRDGKPHPWSYSPGQSWQRESTLQVYSTKEAARKAELESE